MNVSDASLDSGAAPGLTLPTSCADGRARASALEAVQGKFRSTTSLLTYHSAGHALIVGPAAAATSAAAALTGPLVCTVLTDSADGAEQTATSPGVGFAASAQGGASRVTRLAGRLSRLDGHLGEFTAMVPVGGDDEVNLASLVDPRRTHFDLVLDLTIPGYLQREVPPPGYYAPGADAAALQAALEEMPQLVGDFEKPKYFNYNPDICAHGRSGIRGCTRCIEACPTAAIISLGEKVQVDPYLCQGGGSCATACPTGAITYVYPNVSTLLSGLRQLLRSYREAGGGSPCILFHDADTGATSLSSLASRLPEWVLPVQVEEIGAVGMDTWLGALAYGAHRVVLLATAATPKSVMSELGAQLTYAADILEGMGYPAGLVQVLADEDAAAVISSLQTLPTGPAPPPATFAAFDEKRTTIRLAVDHLFSHAPAPRPLAALTAGAPFGEVWLNAQRCTLCMACASACPAGALSAGDDRPQLKFVEDNCVQCGLCARTCPEDAIGPSPRYLYDRGKRLNTRVLYEEQPFCCVVCGKPFATQKVMDKMLQKLATHPMFQAAEALQRLKMCEDCRVRDMFAKEAGGNDAGKG